ncbi:MAG: hypothetical protein WB511_05345 [Nitrososphaeraceae archaeon]|jgi:hypothetical protein
MISTLMHTAVDVAKVRNMIKFADVKEMSQDKFLSVAQQKATPT